MSNRKSARRRLKDISDSRAYLKQARRVRREEKLDHRRARVAVELGGGA